MKLLFKQRFFSWFDSYDIYDEAGNTVYTVAGQLAWGHKLVISSAAGDQLATVKEKVFHLLPRFEIWIGDSLAGTIQKEFTFFKPRYNIDFKGWRVEGNWLEWNYAILDVSDRIIANITKELFHWTDTYVLNVADPGDALCVLAFTLAMDAEKCSRT